MAEPLDQSWYTRDGRKRTVKQRNRYLALQGKLNTEHAKYKNRRLRHIRLNQRNKDAGWFMTPVNYVRDTVMNSPAAFLSQVYKDKDPQARAKYALLYKNRNINGLGDDVTRLRGGHKSNSIQDYGLTLGYKAARDAASLGHLFGLVDKDTVNRLYLKEQEYSNRGGGGLASDWMVRGALLGINWAVGAQALKAAQASKLVQGSKYLKFLAASDKVDDVAKAALKLTRAQKVGKAAIGAAKGTGHFAADMALGIAGDAAGGFANNALDYWLLKNYSPEERERIRTSDWYRRLQSGIQFTGSLAGGSVYGKNRLRRAVTLSPMYTRINAHRYSTDPNNKRYTSLLYKDTAKGIDRALETGMIDPKTGELIATPQHLLDTATADQNAFLRNPLISVPSVNYNGVLPALTLMRDNLDYKRSATHIIDKMKAGEALTPQEAEAAAELLNYIAAVLKATGEPWDPNKPLSQKLINKIQYLGHEQVAVNPIERLGIAVRNFFKPVLNDVRLRVGKYTKLIDTINNSTDSVLILKAKKELQALEKQKLTPRLLYALNYVTPEKMRAIGADAVKGKSLKQVQQLQDHMSNMASGNDPGVQLYYNKFTAQIKKGAENQVVTETLRRSLTMLEKNDILGAMLMSKQLLAMSGAGVDKNNPAFKKIESNLSKCIGKNVWSRPDLWHLAIGLWFNSKGMKTMAGIAGNPMVFWGGLAALLLGGTALIGSMFGGNKTVNNVYNGTSPNQGYSPVHNFGGAGVPVGG